MRSNERHSSLRPAGILRWQLFLIIHLRMMIADSSSIFERLWKFIYTYSLTEQLSLPSVENYEIFLLKVVFEVKGFFKSDNC